MPPSRLRLFAERKSGVKPPHSKMRYGSSGSPASAFGSGAGLGAGGGDFFEALVAGLPAGFFAEDGGLLAGAFATTKYLRIFSNRLGPMPRMARRSSTLLNAP